MARGRLERMGRNDAFNGWALMLLISAAWCYYSFWVLVNPSRLLAEAVGGSCLQLFGTHASGALPMSYQREGRNYGQRARADGMMLCRCFRLSTATTRERPPRNPPAHFLALETSLRGVSWREPFPVRRIQSYFPSSFFALLIPQFIMVRHAPSATPPTCSCPRLLTNRLALSLTWEAWGVGFFFFFFVTLVTGPRRSLSLKLSDTRVYEPQIRALLGTDSHLCEAVVLKLRTVP